MDTLRKRILEYVRRNPGLSAYQIGRALGYEPIGSVGSTLLHLTAKNEVFRRPGGPRGGFVYYIKGHVLDDNNESTSESAPVQTSAQSKDEVDCPGSGLPTVDSGD